MRSGVWVIRYHKDFGYHLGEMGVSDCARPLGGLPSLVLKTRVIRELMSYLKSHSSSGHFLPVENHFV